jgi:hypothetical protein
VNSLSPRAVGVKNSQPWQQRLGRWISIIGLLGVGLLAGCSATRLAYNNAPDLVYWWSDSFFDWNQPQSTLLRNDLNDLQQWHRRQELPGYATTLNALQAAVLQDIQTDQVCALADYLQQRLQATLDRSLPTAVALAPGLSAAQLAHLSEALDQRSREWREEWLDDPPDEREDRRLKKMVARAEQYYGRITTTQRAQLRAQLRASAFDPSLQLHESARRQQDAIQTLRQISANNATGAGSPPQTKAALQALLTRMLESPDPIFQQYARQVRRQACAALADFHNRTSPDQRRHLQQALQGYEADTRALLARE